MRGSPRLRRAGSRARRLTGCLLAGAALPVLMLAQAAGAATVPPWTIQPTQNPGTFNTLGGVSCASATACAAAGDFSNPSFRELPEIWDGISRQVPSLVKGDPLGSAKNSLLAAASCPTVTTSSMSLITRCASISPIQTR
jgi:hypothetical protein